ncbi:MAG TPA: hypothetical protein VHS80_01360, partial [Chthoniobacterales bacterium]|nr:hypothetical protein [Chthoniobacterales bacterium]
ERPETRKIPLQGILNLRSQVGSRDHIEVGRALQRIQTQPAPTPPPTTDAEREEKSIAMQTR